MPWTPSRWSRAKASKAVTIPVTSNAVQKKLGFRMSRCNCVDLGPVFIPEANWKFMTGIKVREPKYQVWNEATL
jgi:hypothetical protein